MRSKKLEIHVRKQLVQKKGNKGNQIPKWNKEDDILVESANQVAKLLKKNCWELNLSKNYDLNQKIYISLSLA